MTTQAQRIIDDELVIVPPGRPNCRQPGGTQTNYGGDKLALPETVWRGAFGEYRSLMANATEAPDGFHYSTLLARAGATLGRRIWFRYGMRLFPNFYIVNFGPTGDRKTTAQRCFENLGNAPLKLISGAGSGEALADEFRDLSPGTSCTFQLEEFSELLRRGKWEGATVLQFLTTCFDCPPQYDQKFRKNPVSLIEPTPNLLAGTTPEWFWASARLSDFQGGFGNRLLFFTGTRKGPIPLPSEPDLTAIQAKVDALAEIPGGEARLNHEAVGLWETFYSAWEAEQQRRDQMLRVTVERIPAYILKIAMVYAAFEYTLPTITYSQLRAAILAGHFCTRCAEELLSLQHAGTNPTKELERRILAFVVRQPRRRTTKREIYRALSRHYSNAAEFDRSFRALERAGELLAEPVGKGSWTVSIP